MRALRSEGRQSSTRRAQEDRTYRIAAGEVHDTVRLIIDLVAGERDEGEIDDEADGRQNRGEERDAEGDDEGPRARVRLEPGRGPTPPPDERGRDQGEEDEDAV